MTSGTWTVKFIAVEVVFEEESLLQALAPHHPRGAVLVRSVVALCQEPPIGGGWIHCCVTNPVLHRDTDSLQRPRSFYLWSLTQDEIGDREPSNASSVNMDRQMPERLRPGLRTRSARRT